jgi:hypothetical protein
MDQIREGKTEDGQAERGEEPSEASHPRKGIVGADPVAPGGVEGHGR